MGIFSRIFGRKFQNPTIGWIADPSVPIQIDLERGRFCGLAPGSSIASLSHLGQSSKPSVSKCDVLFYPNHGFQLFLDDTGFLDVADINISAEEDWAAFTGQWKYGGQVIKVDAESTRWQIREIMGAPDETLDCGLVYKRPGCAICFEWGDGDPECLENVTLGVP
jgi:hypothetical protein